MNLYIIGKHCFSDIWEENVLDRPLFERLAKASDKMIIIASGNHSKGLKKCQYKNITLFLLPKGNFITFALKSFILFRKLNKTTPATVVSASEISASICNLFIKCSSNIPTVMMVQGDLLDLPATHFNLLKRKFIKQLALFLAKKSDAVRAVSEKIAHRLENGGVQKDKIFVLKNRVDNQRFNQSILEEKRIAVRKQYHFKPEQKVITLLSALTIEKGYEDFITLCQKLLAAAPDIGVLVIGDGPLKSWGETSLSAYRERVIHTGFIPQSEVQDYLSAGDIYVFTSHHEGMPRVVLEYMSMGKPIISTPVGGISEVIEDGVNGYLVNVSDTDGMLDKAKKLIENHALGKTLGQNARKKVINEHDLEKTINEQIGLYKKLSSEYLNQ